MFRKLNRQLNKSHHKGLGFALTLCLVVAGAFSPSNVSVATEGDAQATTEAQGEDISTDGNEVTDASLDKAREDAKEARKNKKEAQKILDTLKTSKENMEDYIIDLDKNLNELQIKISHLEQEKKELEDNIKVTEKELETARKAWTKQYADMKYRIRLVYESGNKSYLEILLSATSMTDMLNKSEYASKVAAYDYGVLTELKAAKEKVANLKLKLDRDLASNESVQEQLQSQREVVETLVEEKKKQVEQYNLEIAGQEEELKKYQQALNEAESIIAAAEMAASNSGTVYTGGAFVWPAPGNYDISSPFGGRTSPVAGASTDHKGIDIKCNTGDPVVAAADGTVIVAEYNYAEGNYVCIDHGGGVVTVYMHNSALNVSIGEHVSAGQTIAASGSTGISTGPHIHFGVRVNGSYVDPMIYVQ